MAVPSGFDELCVLLVEDDESMREMISRMLRRMRIGGILEAENAEEALDWIGRVPNALDLVICDWNMPGMTGIELFARLRSTAPRVPFLMLTGRADGDSLAAAQQAGIPGYIVKPTSAPELKAKIAALISAYGDSPQRHRATAKAALSAAPLW
jgi:two-component system chemotaxis response regulator CheY